MTTIFIYFVYIKIIALIFIALFLIGIFYYIKKLKIICKWKEKWQDWWGIIPSIDSTSKSQKKWQAIEQFLSEPHESSWKLAVIQAESIVKKTLILIGYTGKQIKNLKEDEFLNILEELKLRNYQNLNIIFDIHEIRQRIIEDKNFPLDQNKAKEIVKIYKNFWQELLEAL